MKLEAVLLKEEGHAKTPTDIGKILMLASMPR
jgi:hypothetical protein